MGPFMCQKTISMTFFTDRCAWNFIFTEEAEYLNSIDVLFDLGS